MSRFDPNSADKFQERVPFPTGQQTLEVIEAIVRQDKNGNDYLQVTLQVRGIDSTRYVDVLYHSIFRLPSKPWSNHTLEKSQEKHAANQARFLGALGLSIDKGEIQKVVGPDGDGPFDAALLVGRSGSFKVKLVDVKDKDTGLPTGEQRNEISLAPYVEPKGKKK